MVPKKGNLLKLVLVYQIIVLLCYCYGGLRTRCIYKFLGCQAGASPRTFDCGGQIPTGGGGQIRVNQGHLPPNSDFSSDFGHFIQEISKNRKILINIHKFSLKIAISEGIIPPEYRTGGGGNTSLPSPPPCGDAPGWLMTTPVNLNYQSYSTKLFIIIIIDILGWVGCTANFRPQSRLFISTSSHSHICT